MWSKAGNRDSCSEVPAVVSETRRLGIASDSIRAWRRHFEGKHVASVGSVAPESRAQAGGPKVSVVHR